MVLKQHRDNDDILIIDASKGFVKDGKNNRLRACDIKRIADTIRDRATLPGFSRTVERDEIRRNGYNLNIPRYVDSSEAAEPYDIYATMFGGIPESEINQLQTYWDALPSLRADLFQAEPGHPYAGIKSDNITATIEQNTDVCNLKRDFADAFSDFAGVLHHCLITNINSVQESTEQEEITTDIFRRLQQIPLVNKYMAYQLLSDNWETIMSDIETIQTEGIEAVRVVEQAYKIVKSGNEEVEVPDGLKGHILPFGLVQQIKFRAELNAISDKQARVEEIISSLDELRDSLTEEEAEKYLDENDNTKFNKKAITAGAKAKGEDIEPETRAKLKETVGLWDKQTKLNKEIKADKITLEQLTVEAIENLSDEEVELFLHKKWIDPVCEGINDTLSDVLTTLGKRVAALEAKYAVSYNEINRNIADAQNELSELIAQLTGDEFVINGLQEFQNQLKAASLQFIFPQAGETKPRVRFEWFKEEWKRVRFSDLYERSVVKNDLTYKADKIISVANMYYNNPTVSDINYLKTYNVMKLGDIAFEGNKSKHFAHGRFVENTIGDGIVSHVFVVFKPKTIKYDLHYWKYFINNERIMGKILLRCTKSSTMMTDLVVNDFLKETVLVPSFEEQKLIGSFFKQLDLVISLETQRLEKLKQIKSACLDKMFV